MNIVMAIRCMEELGEYARMVNWENGRFLTTHMSSMFIKDFISINEHITINERRYDRNFMDFSRGMILGEWEIAKNPRSWYEEDNKYYSEIYKDEDIIKQLSICK